MFCLTIIFFQHFEMPAVSDRIKISRDGQFCLATGVYKPIVKCYDLENLCLKFERCLDSEVVNFEVLSDDYSKMMFMLADRYIELHARGGRYYRLRIPMFGRDMAYQEDTAETFFVGNKSEVCRLNLEQGRFLNSYKTNSPTLNAIDIMPGHSLVLVSVDHDREKSFNSKLFVRLVVLMVEWRPGTTG